MKRLFLLCLLVGFAIYAVAQEKRALTIDDLVQWNRITERVISDDGSLMAFKTEPAQGDPVVTLYGKDAVLKGTFNCATFVKISADSRYLFFTIKLPYEEERALKLKKTKKDDMPPDKLGILSLIHI